MPGGLPPGMFPAALTVQRIQSFKRKERLTWLFEYRLARGGTKKRPHYNIVIADSRSPRDGRFIEKIGFYNPLLPSDHADRLKLDLDKAKAWIAKGAIASDRVHQFLANAGVVKARVHNNPQEGPAQEEGAGTRRRRRQGRGSAGGVTTCRAGKFVRSYVWRSTHGN